MAVVTPAWAPLVSFSVLILILLAAARIACERRARRVAIGAAGGRRSRSAALATAGLPAFYESFLYLIFSWIALATSWSHPQRLRRLLQLRPRRLLRRRHVHDGDADHRARRAVPLDAARRRRCWRRCSAPGIGAVVFRVKRLRGELFGLLTLAITFVLATIVLNTRIDGGPGVYLSAVPLPRLLASPTGTLYLLGLALAAGHGGRGLRHRAARGSGSGSSPSTTTRTWPRSRACPPFATSSSPSRSRPASPAWPAASTPCT